MNSILTFLGAIVAALLGRVANELWDQVWEQIFLAVAKAEKTWNEGGMGKVKRDWVVDQVTTFIAAKLQEIGKPLAFLDRMIVRLFVGAVADGVVAYANDALGKDWQAKVKELEAKWAGMLPVIE
jgi:hypothetical protein